MSIPSYLPQKSYIKGVWRFEDVGGTTVTDSSGLSHTGTASRAQILGGAAGKIGTCGTFVSASSDVITIVDHADLKPTSYFSISAWFKTTTGTDNIIFASWSGITKLAGFLIGINSNKARILSCRNTGTTYTTDYNGAGSVADVADGLWHFTCGVWDGTNLKMYLDNAAVVNTAWTYAPAYTTNYVRIGSRRDNASDLLFFNGNIDEVVLWNGIALSANEVAQVYSHSPGRNFSFGNPWMFIKDAWEKHDKLWTPKLVIPKLKLSEGFSY
jgi:hypothetical protein